MLTIPYKPYILIKNSQVIKNVQKFLEIIVLLQSKDIILKTIPLKIFKF